MLLPALAGSSQFPACAAGAQEVRSGRRLGGPFVVVIIDVEKSCAEGQFVPDLDVGFVDRRDQGFGSPVVGRGQAFTLHFTVAGEEDGVGFHFCIAEPATT